MPIIFIFPASDYFKSLLTTLFDILYSHSSLTVGRSTQSLMIWIQIALKSTTVTSRILKLWRWSFRWRGSFAVWRPSLHQDLLSLTWGGLHRYMESNSVLLNGNKLSTVRISSHGQCWQRPPGRQGQSLVDHAISSMQTMRHQYVDSWTYQTYPQVLRHPSTLLQLLVLQSHWLL